MNRSRGLAAALAIPVAVALGLSACDQEPKQVFAEELVVARIDDRELTRGQFESYLRYAVHLPDEPPTTPDDNGNPGEEDFSDEVRSRLFDRYVTEQLLVDRARAAGIEVDAVRLDQFAQSMGLGTVAEFHEGMPLTQREYLREYLEHSYLVKRYIDEQIVSGIRVSDEELLAQYEGSIESFRVPDRFRLRLIRVDTMRDALELKKRVRGNVDQFLAAATELSEGDDEHGHDLGLWRADHLPEAFAEVVTTLEAGQVSDIIQDPDGGFNLLLVEERVPSEVLAFASVRDRLRRDTRRKRANEAVAEATASARARAQIELFVTNLGFTYYPDEREAHARSAPPDTRMAGQLDAAARIDGGSPWQLV